MMMSKSIQGQITTSLMVNSLWERSNLHPQSEMFLHSLCRSLHRRNWLESLFQINIELI